MIDLRDDHLVGANVHESDREERANGQANGEDNVGARGGIQIERDDNTWIGGGLLESEGVDRLQDFGLQAQFAKGRVRGSLR